MSLQKQKLLRKILKHIIFIMALTLATSFIGCGNKNDEAKQASVAIADAYIAEPFLIENIQSVHMAVSHGNIIYISGFEYPPDYQDGDYGTEQYLYYLDMDLEEPEAVKIPYVLEPDSFISSFSVNLDGSLNLAILSFSDESVVDAKSEIIIKRINRDGTEISRIMLADDIKDLYVYPQNLLIDKAGLIYLVNSGTVYIFNKDGNLFSKIPVGSFNFKMSWDRAYENIYLTWPINTGGGKIAIIDTDSGFLGQSYDINATFNCYGFTPGLGSDFLFATETGVYTYDLQSQSYGQVFDWNSVSIMVDNYGSFLPLSDGRVGWIVSTARGINMRVIRPLREDETIIEKETLLIGGVWFYIDDALRTAIIEFNMTNPRYRIEIKDYSDNGADVDGGMTRLNFDIINGKGPDIIVLPNAFSMNHYARKGVLTDLYPYIDAMERADFQENIIKAYESDGQLLGMPVSYLINTLVAAKSELGDVQSWNLDEMIEYVNSRLPDSKVFFDHSKSGVLRLCLRANGEALVDWDSDDSGFQRDLFLKMLYFADQFTPDHLYVFDDNIIDRIQDGQILLFSNMMYHYLNHYNLLTYFGESIVYPGFPSENGSGNLIASLAVLAINQNSQHKGAAWEFISSMLAEEFQIRDCHLPVFPILKSAHDAKIKETFKALHDEKGAFYASGTESDIQTVIDLINRAEKIRVHDEHILNIVMEEAGSFFSGAKSAEEAADIAENRIAIYVSEMK